MAFSCLWWVGVINLFRSQLQDCAFTQEVAVSRFICFSKFSYTSLEIWTILFIIMGLLRVPKQPYWLKNYFE